MSCTQSGQNNFIYSFELLHKASLFYITKDDITLQHIAIMSLCCEVISTFVIFAVLDLRVPD